MNWLKKKADDSNFISGNYVISFEVYISPKSEMTENDYLEALRYALEDVSYFPGSLTFDKK